MRSCDQELIGDSPGNQLFVGGIHPRTSKGRDLSQADLVDYFSQFGPLAECRMIFDKVTRKQCLTAEKFRGFCFVTFRDESAARGVLEIKTHYLKGQSVGLF